MPKFKVSTRKTANLPEIVLPNVRSGDQMVTANLRELPTSNPPIARIYCIGKVDKKVTFWSYANFYLMPIYCK